MGTSESKASNNPQGSKATSSVSATPLSSSTRSKCAALLLDGDYIITDIEHDGIWDATFSRTALSVTNIPELENEGFREHRFGMEKRPEADRPQQSKTSSSSAQQQPQQRSISNNVIGQSLSAVVGRETFATLVEVISGSKTKKSSLQRGGGSSSSPSASAPVSLRWQVAANRIVNKKGVVSSPAASATTVAAEYVLVLDGTKKGSADASGEKKKEKSSGGFMCCSAPKRPPEHKYRHGARRAEEDSEDEEDGEDINHAHSRRERASNSSAVRKLWVVPAHFAMADKTLAANAAQLYECVQCKNLSLDTAEEVYATPQTLLPYLASTGVTLLHNISLTSCSKCLEGLSEATRKAKRGVGTTNLQQAGGGTSYTTSAGEHGETFHDCLSEDSSSLVTNDQLHSESGFWTTTPGSERLVSTSAAGSPTHVHIGPKGKVGSVVSTSLFAKRKTSLLSSSTLVSPISDTNANNSRPFSPKMSRHQSVLLAAGGDEDDLLEDMDEDEREAYNNQVAATPRDTPAGDGGGGGGVDDPAFGSFVEVQGGPGTGSGMMSPLQVPRMNSPHTIVRVRGDDDDNINAVSSGQPPEFDSVILPSVFSKQQKPTATAARATALPTAILFIEDHEIKTATRRALMSKGILAVETSTVAELERRLSSQAALQRHGGDDGGGGNTMIIASMLNRGVSVGELVRYLTKKAHRSSLMTSPTAQQRGQQQPHYLDVPPIVAIGASHFSSTAISAGCAGFITLKKVAQKSAKAQPPSSGVDTNEVLRIVTPFLGGND